MGIEMVFVGPVWIAAIVLAVAGSWKLVEPGPARDALRALRLPPGIAVLATRSTVPVRLLGAAEVALAVVVVASGGRVAPVLLSVAYLGFALVAERLRRTPGGASCGCFGQRSTPPGLLHVAVNILAAGVALGAAGLGTPSLAFAARTLPGGLVPVGFSALVGAAGVVALLTVLPEVRAAGRPDDEATGSAARSGQPHLFGPTIGLRPGLRPGQGMNPNGNVNALETAGAPG